MMPPGRNVVEAGAKAAKSYTRRAIKKRESGVLLSLFFIVRANHSTRIITSLRLRNHSSKGGL